ncbi:MAG TPA: STAS domain-containing protein [Longimicrobiaceae bacterium]|nr:STAS domain-containing protein [Longimicrobiaceae bacterium]
MAQTGEQIVAEALGTDVQELLEAWVREQASATTTRAHLITEAELRQQSVEFLNLVRDAVGSGNASDVQAPEWAAVREFLARLSRARAVQGFSPADTAMFVLSLKQPLFGRLRGMLADRPEPLLDAVWSATTLLDRLGLLTTEAHQRSREDVIQRQQQELLELSTPVVKLWDGVVAVPLIGTLDSARTQIVMENLLQKIVEIGASIAIIDITGVPTVDTLVAQHLLKTVAAARLMGAECIISGIRPQIAQTIVHLGVELHGTTTKANLADAIATALRLTGWRISRVTG